jgi:hypothetical protein
VVPDEYSVDMFDGSQGKGKNDSVHKTFLDYMNTELAMSVLGNNLSTEVQGGSFAAATALMGVREDFIEGDQKVGEWVFTELIKRTHSYNFNSEPPKLVLLRKEKIDIERVDRDSKLVVMIPGMNFTDKYLQEKYNLNKDDYDIEDIKPEPNKKPKLPNKDDDDAEDDSGN